MNMQAKSKVAIVGSGFGGLSLAIRLQAQGFQVHLYEKREKVGGRAYQLKDKGYTFDMGPSLITAPEIIQSVFASAGKKLEDYLDLMPLDPYYRVYFHDGTFIDYTGDSEQMKSQMAAFNVQDAENYDAFMEDIKPIYDTVITDGLGAKPFDTIKSMLAFVPRFLKLKAYLPVHAYVKRYFKDVRHRFLFSFHPLFIGGNPFKAPSIYLMIPYLEKKDGVWFTKGGMYSVVEAFEKVFLELGGTIHTSSEVEAILVQDKQAKGLRVNGVDHSADLVVSNADVGQTYKMIEEAHRPKWNDKKLKKLDYTMSCFLLYMGVKKKYPKLEHHTLILSQRYKELIRDIFDNRILADDFSMYLHVPTKTDPEMAPEGCESMYVLIPVPNHKAQLDWQEIKEGFADKVLSFLEEWGLSELKEHLDVLHIFTPDDFAAKLNATQGNAFGVEPKLLQTAYFRPHNRSEDVEHLYMVGASTHPGAGVPGVMLSAETTFHCIMEDAKAGKLPAPTTRALLTGPTSQS
jgi:phytoene desaturase